MGEKRRLKSQGKTAKSTKHGLRPHELRQQQENDKNAGTQTVSPPARKEARSS